MAARQPQIPRRVAVIGAGPAGAAAARRLCAAGHAVVVFEKGATVGGRASTYRRGGRQVDTGAAFVTNFYPRVWALARKEGFAGEIQDFSRITGLWHDGRLAHMDVGSLSSFLRFPFLSLAQKLRMSYWTARQTLKRPQLDIALPETLVDFDHQSIGDLARAKLGEAVFHYLVRPGVEPFWYFDCEEASAALVEGLTAHAAGARFYFFKSGIDAVSRALLEGVELRLSCPVVEVSHSGGEVSLALGAQRETFEAAVVATTASVADRLTAGLDERLVSASQRGHLTSQRYAANIHITYAIPRLDPPPEVNSIFPCGPGNHDLAALSFHRFKGVVSTLEDELVSVYLSDRVSRALMGSSDAEVHSRGLELARRVCPELPREAEVFHMVRRAEAIPVHAVGRYRQAAAFKREQSSGDSPILFCGDHLATATVDGAMASGYAAADALLSRW